VQLTNLARVNGDPTRPPSRIPGTDPANLDGLIFQRRSMPAPDDFTAIGQVAADRARRLAATIATPGFATAETLTVAGFDLTLPVCRALVGDEPVRVGGGADGTDDNVVPFGAPPGGGTRRDVLLLESWVAEVAPIGASDGATSQALPVAGGLGNPNLAGDARFAIRNPAISGETTRRTQVRWRLRVAEGVDLTTYPDALGDPTILGRGDAAAPVLGKPFGAVPHRPTLYRAGDGSLADAASFANATGYTFALPIVALLRTAGETALTLTGAIDLRRPIVARVGVATAQSVVVLSRGNYSVGTMPGETTTWRQPGGGNADAPTPDTIAGADDDTPLTGAFPLFPSDFDLPPGWRLRGQLCGVVWRQRSADDTATHSFGIRVRAPSQVYGEAASSGTWTLTASASLGSTARVEDHLDEFALVADGSDDGLWVVELYTDQAGPNNWDTAGVYLRIWATNA
jgi:hypothetical protein